MNIDEAAEEIAKHAKEEIARHALARKERHTRIARQAAVSEWLREASVLVAVFPIIDQVIRRDPVNWEVIAGSLTVALILFGVGYTLTRGD